MNPLALSSFRRACLPALFLIMLALPFAGQMNPALFQGMKWRLIGPFRGGRVLAVSGVPGHPRTFYFGAVAGGVWKTTDAGLTWRPVFDHQPVSSIGAIAVAPSDPNLIYVGTGESDPRANISFGDGMYKSLDGGKTWQRIGLAHTRHIAAIVVDPRDANRVYVAALGHVFDDNTERGIYRSLDGGKTWQRVLFVNDQTGGDDVVFDPRNPHILFASMWQERRQPWGYTSGGPGSGLYKSLNGGATWKRIAGHGFAAGVLGKIGVAVAANGRRVYAQVEAKKGGLYVSNDLGTHWKLVNSDQNFRQRAWYFTHIFADPRNADTLYELNVNFFRSTDGGRTFKRMAVPHGDNHGMWIAPHHPGRMIVGNDGGATISLNHGKSWSTLYNQPTAQFYHVAVDSRFPFYVYGAQQDNSSVAIASQSKWGAITARDWYPVGGGESGYILPDPRNPHIVYAGSYFGILTRFDQRTAEVQDISPWPDDTDGEAAAGLKYRFTWTMPLAFSPQNPQVLYFASQYLFETDNGGMSWRRISPDLSRNDKRKQQSSGGPITQDNASAEYYDLIYTIAPSPRRAGLIWVGTDDGLIQLTRNGGKSWANVTPPALPAWSKISLIAASPFHAGSAYAAVNRRKLGNLEPLIYKTSDYGRSWRKIIAGLPADADVHVVREDPKKEGLLYCGTETGVYVSFDAGAHWQPLQLNLPTAPVRDLAIKNNELVAATHGRAFWILDDLSPLRRITAALATRPVYLYPPAPAWRLRIPHFNVKPGMAVGANPLAGAMIDYYLKTIPRGNISLRILDARGRLVHAFSSRKLPPPPPIYANLYPHPPHSIHPQLPKKAGMNRFVWNLRYPRPPAIPRAIYDEGDPIGVLALPGNYQVQLIVAGRTYTRPLIIRPDPRLHLPLAAMAAQQALMFKLNSDMAADHRAVLAIQSLDRQLRSLVARLDKTPADASLAAAARALDHRLLAVEDRLYQPKAKAGEEMLNFPTELNSKLGYLENSVDSADSAPTAQQYAYDRVLHGQLAAQLALWQRLRRQDLAVLNRAIAAHRLPAVF